MYKKPQSSSVELKNTNAVSLFGVRSQTKER